MRITHTEIYRLNIPMEPFTIATGTMNYAQNVFIRIHTDEGIYGAGECSAFPVIVGETQDTCITLAKDFARLWKNKPVAPIASRLQELHHYCARNYTIKSAFDMALHDLSAKAAGLPLYAYLGNSGKVKRDIHTDITVGIADKETMAAKAASYVVQGAQHLKIKLGKRPSDDIQRIATIRQAVGPAVSIRIDANQGWDFDAAVKALTGLAQYDIAFCEQPMGSWDDDLLPALRSKTSIPIMADESCYTAHDARRLIRTGSCDYINIKLAKCGGLSEALNILKVCADAGMACMIGGMLESRFALTANLHLAYASPNIRFFDLDSPLLGLLEDPVVGGAQYHQGYGLVTDDATGIGADMDNAYLKNCEKHVV
ncbi:L-alanine-DL-glutamate epimerase [Parapedobacter composti]|uniref:Dipeptide epimerase n=1 Tax=Parapedobacter composti TaxID=623281 RepID=A0A1I1L0V3_9SPHI|nr:dipeptide epimerase [Parapedobacter composti]SFC66621.1 L-alanine-DL-glutamate epimerase [Parapedobacter composti]